MFFLTLVIADAQGQVEIYNKRFSLGYNNLVFRSIEITDTCFFISGIGADSTSGSFFARFDFSGVPNYFKLNKGDNQSLMTWGRDFQQFSQDQWIVSGEGADNTGAYVIIVILNSQGDTLQIARIYHPNHPEEQFIVAAAGIEKFENQWFVLMNIHDPSTSTTPSNDLFLAKMSQNLDIEWTKHYKYPKNEYGKCAVQVGQNFLLGAWRTNFNTNNKNFTTQLYFVRIDTLNGDITKTFLYPYTPTNQLLMGPADDMLVEDDGSLIVATRIGKEEPINQNQSYIRWTSAVLKVNANLSEVLWVQTMFSGNTSDATQFFKIVGAPDQSGYVAVGVATYEPGIFGGALAKVSPEGDSLWLRHYKYVSSPLAIHYLYDLEATPDGGYVMVGEARAGIADTLFPPPVQQGWILKVDEWGCLVPGCQLDVATKDAPAGEGMRLKVYPNPASEVLYIHLPDAGPQGRFRLIDALGHTLREFAASPGDTTYILPLEGIPPGWYVVWYEEGERRLTASVYRF